MYEELKQIVERAWDDRTLLREKSVCATIDAVIEELDKGRLRTAEPLDEERTQ
ncbi:MAG: 2,3,4,5-tetrahydropyridine-2,6-dicarboxylate N-succinyltransferase, partial [Alistipes sp.]